MSAAVRLDHEYEVDHPVVACDGDGGALGHPRVYLTIGESGRVECPYCSRVYRLKAGATHSHGH